MYYEIVKNPIALDVIRRRLGTMQYGCVSKFEADFTLMVNNARQFNQAGSPVADAAEALFVAMQGALDAVRSELAAESAPASQ